MGNDLVREITELKQKLKVAELRSKRLNFTFSTPKEFRGNRTGTAYESGYNAGWRGWNYDQPYTTSHHRRAYLNGFRNAEQALREAAAK